MTRSTEDENDRRERRWARKRQRLDAPSPVCEGCATRFVAALYQAFFPDNPTGLHRRSVDHHPAGRHVDEEFTVSECSYHAAVLDDLRNDWDPRLLTPRTLHEKYLATLWGIADLLDVRGGTDQKIARRIRQIIRAELDGGATTEDPPCEK